MRVLSLPVSSEDENDQRLTLESFAVKFVRIESFCIS